MTESSINSAPYPFMPHPAHRAMTTVDAVVFTKAAELLANPYISTALRSAGGGDAHIAHFSREACSGRPASAWAASQDADTVKAALRKVAKDMEMNDAE
jgi:hypothetical protein